MRIKNHWKIIPYLWQYPRNQQGYSGEYIFLNEKGQRIKSEGGIFETSGKLRLDDDLDEIAEAFVKFAKKEKFEWWSKW